MFASVKRERKSAKSYLHSPSEASLDSALLFEWNKLCS